MRTMYSLTKNKQIDGISRRLTLLKFYHALLINIYLNKSFPSKLDIVSLNDAPLLLKYEVVAHGKPLYCENETERINFEVSVIKEYIDEEPIRKLYNQALHKRIIQGT